MDFSSLTRRELQTLCKNNKLPANLTNVAMADSLKALEHVEGLEELLNQSPEKTMNGSLSIPRTAARTSTRRKPINEEPESSQPLTRSRRGTRKPVTEDVDQEKTEVLNTPAAAPSTRRRAPVTSARQKTETLKVVQSVYNTRRSVRLLEKTMAKMSLDNEDSMPLKMDELSTEINDGSVDNGSNMQTVSETSSERVDVSEVISEPKSDEKMETEGQLKDEVQQNNKIDMIEVGDNSKPKSELESEVSESKSASDALNAVSEVMDESHEEGSAEADDKEPRDEGVNESLSEEKSTDSMSCEADNTESAEEVKQEALTLSFSEQQLALSSKDSVMYRAEGDYSEKFDFESDFEGDSATEEDADDSSTEEESNEGESVDENPFDCQGKQSDIVQAGERDFGCENSVAEGLVDANVKFEMPISSKQMSPLCPLTVHEKTPQSKALLDDYEGAPALDKTPTLPPLAADQLAHQFPRPTLFKSGKSASKKQSEIMNYMFDDNNANTDNNEGVEIKRDNDATNKNIMQKDLEPKTASLRQLKKMLKQKLTIVDNKMTKSEDNYGTKMVEKPRTALQEVPENQMAVNKPGNGN